MPNLHRGEIEACLDGKPLRLCLTLGALAELESAFGDTDMLALAERFQSGRLSARDAQLIIGAGLRGAGHDIADAAGFVDIVARLLAATFGGGAPGSDPASVELPSPSSRRHVSDMTRGGAGGGVGPAARGGSEAAPAEGRAGSTPFPGTP
jgi:hypothetical protein